MAKENHGFAALSKYRLKNLARKGGQAAQHKGTAHRFTPEESAKNNLVTQTPERRREIGAAGGRASKRSRKASHWRTSDQARRAALKKSRFFDSAWNYEKVPKKLTLCVQEAVEYTRLSVRTIYNCLKDGRLTRVKGTRGIRVSTVSILALIERYQKLR